MKWTNKPVFRFVLALIILLCLEAIPSSQGSVYSSSAVDKEAWKDEIIKSIMTTYEGESFVRILFYLEEEDKAYKDSDVPAPVWRILRSTMANPSQFKQYSDRLLLDTEKADREPKFRETMNQIYSEMMDASDDPLPGNVHQIFDLRRKANMDILQGSTLAGLARAWDILSPDNKANILATISKLATNSQLVSTSNEVLQLVDAAGGKRVIIGLSAVYLAVEVEKNLERWWKGEITGVRCSKNIIDSSVSMCSGVAGGILGAKVGSLGGPVGTAAGGIIGGLLSAQVGSILSDRLTQTLFGIPKNEAVENAYNFFGVKMTASNDEINKAFRQLSLINYPGNGGRGEDFIEAQIKMSVIKMARGT